MSKFKKGQLVEVINDDRHPQYNGTRFTIEGRYMSEVHGQYMYHLPKSLQSEGAVICREENLKAVNPDNDEQSDFTFNELMSDLTKRNQLTHNTK